MKISKTLPALMLTALLLASCAPQPAQTTAEPVAPVQAATQAPPQAEAPLPAAATEVSAPAVEAPPAVATSRGDKLEATDPATVSLASGGVQLVEFFRFT